MGTANDILIRKLGDLKARLEHIAKRNERSTEAEARYAIREHVEREEEKLKQKK